ncbi:MAG: ATP-binding cassette domain-containing protein [Propionibacteriaceae bacterium]|nr:ATP-binding cassette domain-containing protein [Propionibacteriaceae bacterium]
MPGSANPALGLQGARNPGSSLGFQPSGGAASKTAEPATGFSQAILPDEAAAVLRVRHLGRRFDGVQAVDDVSFDVAAGEVVSLIGPNGSGKSTTLNLISGLVPAHSGRIELAGEPIAGLAPEQIAERLLSRTFQNGRVFGALSVEDNVRIGLQPVLRAARPWPRLRRLPLLRWLPLLAETWLALAPGPACRREAAAADRRATAELARFGDRLSPRRRRQAHTLSYANRRRTEVARALVSSPRLLLLDEPTAGMNQTETAEVLGQLLALKAAGQAILLVEHKIDLVLALSDRVLVLDNGRIISAGLPAAVRQDPAVIEAYLGQRLAAGPGAPPASAVPRPGAALASATAFAPPPGLAPPLLTVNGVDVFYGPVQALRGVSLEVRPGEIVSLLGGNASGKSTTMKTILGLLRPRVGEVWLAGRDITFSPTPQRIRLGLASVPEARRIFAEMTVAENLLAGAYVRRDRAGVADDQARLFDHFPRLAERRRQAAGSLSGGEQQMLAFARALMSRPRVMCLDEPTMGLSPLFVERVLAEVARLRDELGVAVLMVEQQAELALSVADRAYVLASGQIVLAGDAADLRDDGSVQEAYLGKAPGDSPGRFRGRPPDYII